MRSAGCEARKAGNTVVRNNREADITTALSAMTRKLEKPTRLGVFRGK
jgi:hypothetical protein